MRENDKVIKMRERNGAPRHEDEKLEAIIASAVERAYSQRDQSFLETMNKLVNRLELGISRMTTSFEAFVAGEKDVAVASMVLGEDDDLPRLARYKANASLIFSHSAGDIAAELGLPVAKVAFLLNRSGLDWTGTKHDLWDKQLFAKTRRRLWHPETVSLLRAVLCDPAHPSRKDASPSCKRVLEQCSTLLSG